MRRNTDNSRILRKTNNKRYALNLNRFFELVTAKSVNENNNESTITEVWQTNGGDDMTLVNKEIVDNKININNSLCAARYDFLKEIITNILSYLQTPDGDLFVDESQLSFGQKIVFETFIKEGVIYEIKEEND